MRKKDLELEQAAMRKRGAEARRNAHTLGEQSDRNTKTQERQPVSNGVQPVVPHAVGSSGPSPLSKKQIATEDVRRRANRKELQPPTQPLLYWRGRSGKHIGSIRDVTLYGCFLNTQGQAHIGEVVSLKTSLPTGEVIELRGTVVHHQHDKLFGYGLKFENLSERERMYLRLLMADV